MLYTTANDRVNTYIATTVERATALLDRHAKRVWPRLTWDSRLRQLWHAKRPTYKKVGGLHIFKLGRLGFQFYRSKRGATAVEYALITAGIALAVLTVVNTLGAKVAATLGKVVAGLG